MNGPDRQLTTAEVAAIAEVDPAAVRKWVFRKHLRRDARGLISGRALLAYLDSRGTVGQHARPRPDTPTVL